MKQKGSGPPPNLAVLLWPLLCLLGLLSAPTGTAAANPYDPHSSCTTPFFEGWFIRISSSSTSFAFGIGHLPDQHPSNPSAACFLISNPAPTAGAAVAPARSFVHYFSGLDVHPSKQQAGCTDCPAFVAAGSNAQGSCRLEVSGSLVNIEAEMQGSFKLSASNNPPSASIVPWGPYPGSSPEGWLPAGLLKLHWYVYSMATPITYNLTLLEAAHAAVVPDKQQHSQQQDEPVTHHLPQHSRQASAVQQGDNESAADALLAASAGNETPADDAATVAPAAAAAAAPAPAAVQVSGVGYAHMEKNWGDSFPEEWVWAQGVSSNGQASFVLAGGSLPIKSPSTRLGSAAASLQSLIWQHLLPISSSTAGSNTLLAFAFSYHSPGLNLTVDPSNPGWVTSFEPCGCCGSLAVTLSSWSHQVVLRVDAAPGSFTGLPCPTEDGFRYKSDESFSATAHVRVYGSGAAAAGGSLFNNAHDKARRLRLRSTAPHGAADRLSLLAGDVFEGAALEFGGSLRCGGSGSGANGLQIS